MARKVGKGSTLVMNSEVLYQGFKIREGHRKGDLKTYLLEDKDSAQMSAIYPPVLLVTTISFVTLAQAKRLGTRLDSC